MSNMATEGGGGGNVFTRKIGPLPMWGWMAIALLLAVFYYLYRKNTAAKAGSSSPSTVNTPGGVDASLVPQFVNQTYTNVTPPAAPQVTVNNTTPPPAAPPDNDVDTDRHHTNEGDEDNDRDRRFGVPNGSNNAPHQGPSHTSTSTTTLHYSWTDTGQKWSANQLASKLGISVKALVPTNRLGQKALSDPNAPIARGAAFDYVKEPKGVTTTQTR